MEAVNNNTLSKQVFLTKTPRIEDTQAVRVPPPKDNLPHVKPFTVLDRDTEQIAAEMGMITPKQNQANEAMTSQLSRMTTNSGKIEAMKNNQYSQGFEQRRAQSVEAGGKSRDFMASLAATKPVEVKKESWLKRMIKKLYW